MIEIDGGVSLKNIGKLAKAGTEILVAGSSVFKTDNIPSRDKRNRYCINLVSVSGNSV
jgi:ribulose-phosphate 3-epimerase